MSKNQVTFDRAKKRAEQERLVKLFVRTCEACDEYDESQRAAKRAVEKMHQTVTALECAAHALETLTSEGHPENLVKTVFARHGNDATFTQLIDYRIEVEIIAGQCLRIAADLKLASEHLDGSREQPRGNQSNLVLRVMIFAAATSYFELTGGRKPGSSRSDYGPFGCFVEELIALIPQARRPLMPSPAAVADVIKVWRETQTDRRT